MLSLTQIIKLAGAATLVALTAASIPALAPIRPQERIFLDPNPPAGSPFGQTHPLAPTVLARH